MELLCLTKEQFRERLTEFCDLYRSCFSDYIDEAIIKQRFLDHPSDSLLMCVAIDDGKIVANYCAIPMVVNVHGKLIKAAISVNTMTHPQYAGKGLFTTLATKLYEKMADEGYTLLYGFPNYLSNKTFVYKMGWKDIYEIPTMEYKIDQTALQRSGEHSFAPCNISDIEQAETQDKIFIAKDSAYMKWRYEDIADKTYFAAKNQQGDWIIYKFYDTQINVVESHLSSQEALTQMCNYLATVAKAENKTEITLWCPINTEKHYWLEKKGFINRAPVRYFAAKQLLPFDVDLFDYRDWNIAMGDDNVY